MPDASRETQPLKRLKTAMGSYWKKLAWIWVWRHVPLGFGAILRSRWVWRRVGLGLRRVGLGSAPPRP